MSHIHKPENALLPQIVISEAELARRWKVSKRTIQRWRNEGRLPDWFRIGRKVLFRVEAIEMVECASKSNAGEP